jgi:hypothetical protein
MEYILLLTACINPDGMPFTCLADVGVRKKQYIEALNFYLKNTTRKIVFVENSGTDISSSFKDFQHRIEFLCFDGNLCFDKRKGKGYGEALGMDASRIAGYTLKIDEAATEFKQDGMTAEQVQAKFAQILSDQVATYAEGVAGQVGGIQSIQKVGETAQEALSRAYGWWNAEQQAQIAILNAQGKPQEALNRQRELDIALLSEDEKVSRRRIFALEDQVTRETQLAGLTDRWNAASMTKTQLLEQEAKQYDISNVGLLFAVATLEEAKDLQQRLNEATMSRTELLALERAQILPGNQALFDSVQLAEERKSLDQRLNIFVQTRSLK